MNAPIALTLGDPAGIGPELAAHNYSQYRVFSRGPFLPGKFITSIPD